MPLHIDALPIHPGWKPVLHHPKIQRPLLQAWQWAEARQQSHSVLPDQADWLRALRYTPPEDIKAIILGQDPYPNKTDAMGLSFSVPPSAKIAGSLRNIRKELARDMPEQTLPDHGDLTGWAKQGVLLLNTVLTVDEGDAGAHLRQAGWERFTTALLTYLAQVNPAMVVLAWGKKAHAVAEIFNAPHSVIRTSHPSGLGHYRHGKTFTAFTGSGCFSMTNDILIANDRPSINWFKLEKGQ